jgi:murein L,D-transpeptidase YcbB/YkuD
MPMSARVAPLPGGAGLSVRLAPFAQALKAELAGADPAVAAFYERRGYRPLWVQGWGLRPGAEAVVQAVSEARADGLDPKAYGAEALPGLIAAAKRGRLQDLARAEAALSEAAAGYLSDLHTARPGAGIVYADAAVAPPAADPAAVLERIARAASPAAAVADLRRMNPLYEDLRTALAAWKARGGSAVGRRRIRVNLERARGLPADLGERYILVDAAAQTLWLYDHGKAVGSMPVVVGKASEPTPVMAGLIRFAVVRPYWNVPPDLVRDSIAPKVLRYGTAWLASQDMEALSGWSEDARVLSPDAVDWAAVAAGRQVLRVRQRPGPHNMMGRVKFMFPNRLGVYLHDTPLRQYFAEETRTESSGCVRLADAPRLARWLMGPQAGLVGEPGGPETRVDLARPVPVYILYFTAAPTAEGLSFRRDIYHRDAPLEASLAAASAQA